MWLVYNFNKEKRLYRADMFNCASTRGDDYPESGWGETEALAKEDFINKNKSRIDRVNDMLNEVLLDLLGDESKVDEVFDYLKKKLNEQGPYVVSNESMEDTCLKQ